MNAPMRATSSLTDLQRQQEAHDLANHWDILCLPAQDRLKHMVLHFAKYVGRLAGNSGDRRSFESTVIDTFIIGLATANALNVNLGSMCQLMQDVKEDIQAKKTPENFLAGLAIATGRMAKACEALDHVESFNSRQELEAGVVTICNLCLQAAAMNNFHVAEKVFSRWKQVESKRAL